MKKSTSHTTPTVLVIDNDPIDRETLSALLEEEGYLCQQAESSLVAMRVLEDGWLGKAVHIKVVIADLYGSDLCNLDILGYIKKCDHFQTTQVIVLTREISDTLWLEAKQEGAYAIFTKPCNFDDLQRVIRQIINGEKDWLGSRL